MKNIETDQFSLTKFRLKSPSAVLLPLCPVGVELSEYRRVRHVLLQPRWSGYVTPCRR